MGKSARLFVAVPVPDAVMRAIVGLIDELKETGADVRWVRPESIHLTLMFLGEVPEEEIVDIGNLLREGIAGLQRFSVECLGVGAFPSVRNPRVWWVGIKDAGQLKELADAVRTPLGKFGAGGNDRQSFRPHLTVGRVRSSRGRGNVQKVVQGFEQRSFGDIPVEKVSLMQSTLRPEGALHQEIVSIPLAQAEQGPGVPGPEGSQRKER